MTEPDSETPSTNLSPRVVVDLLREGGLRRWVVVVALAALVSGIELVGAVLILATLQLVTGPAEAVRLPFVGAVTSVLSPSLFLLAVGVFFLVRGVINIVSAYAQQKAAQVTGVMLATRLVRGYLTMPYERHLRRNSSELIRNAIESTSNVVAYVFVPFVLVIGEGLVTVALLGLLFVLAPAASLLAIVVFAPVVVVLLKVVQPRLASLGEAAQVAYKDSLQTLTQSIEGIRDVKILGREHFFARAFFRQRLELARSQYIRATLTDVPRLSLETIMVLFIVAFLAVGEMRGVASAGTVPVLGMFGYVALRLLPALNRIIASVNTIRYGTAAAHHVHADLEMEDVREPTAGTPAHLAETIRCDNVDFAYAGTERPALRGIDVTIRRGESIGIVGPTGAGKTTLLDVLLGLLPPTSGRVLVDGIDIAGHVRGWQATVGIVPQQVFLLDASLKQNIALGQSDTDIDPERIAASVRMAQLDTVVAALPQGLDTHVGERGVRLSGGQRQRVAIARALYLQPSVLVFDEGTSALDAGTEAQVVEALDALPGDPTVIAVAHRLSTVRRCDRILLLDQGRLRAVGTYDELLARDPLFQRLASSPETLAAEGAAAGHEQPS